MPRPSRKTERQTQILDAYGRCLAMYGVEGATLERIAAEADLARALIRHNVGNRSELLDLFVERFLARSEQMTADLLAALPREGAQQVLIDWLFDPEQADDQAIRIANALIVAAAEQPDLAFKMRNWSQAFIDALNSVFNDPVTSVGISSLYADVEAMSPLGGGQGHRALARQAAYRLAGLNAPD